jgi:hypothetical protein
LSNAALRSAMAVSCVKMATDGPHGNHHRDPRNKAPPEEIPDEPGR